MFIVLSYSNLIYILNQYVCVCDNDAPKKRYY